VTPRRGFDPDRIRAGSIRRFHDVWDALRHGRTAPSPRDFVPEDFFEWWPNLIVIDVDAGRQPPLFRYREVGSDLERRLDQGLAGEIVPHLPEEQWAGTQYGAYRICVDSLRPNYQYARISLGKAREGGFERLVVPFSSADRRVEMLVACMLFDDPQTWKETG